MAPTVLSLPLSQIIAADAPLLSPTAMTADNQWEQPLFSPNDSFTYAYYNMPPSPPLSDNDDHPQAALKLRIPPATADAVPVCIPTHQLFDLADPPRPPTPPSREPSVADDTKHQDDPAFVPSKRSASPAPSLPKKRAIGERISSKDFIPPDVSGLSKREARLVKNRAAAFLSRQRKREEFECMEVRVAELEQENARLLALTQTGVTNLPPQQPPSDNQLVSEVELLKAQLAQAQERERTLSAQLANNAAPHVPIKVEEPQFLLSSPSRSSPIPSAHKSGASLGLMVLLCALPSLISMRMQPSAPTSFAIPNPFPASSSAFNSFNFDWAKASGSASSFMDLDSSDSRPASSMKKLEFTGIDSDMEGLGDLDISFDASPSDGGKIRVRIHPSSSVSSRAQSPGAASSTDGMQQDGSSSPSSTASSLPMWSSASDSASKMNSFGSTSSSDPFLGITGDYGMDSFSNDGLFESALDSLSSGSSLNYGQMSEFGHGSEYSVPDSTSASGRRRVRIALKSMPQAGGEGGEWEVQIC